MRGGGGGEGRGKRADERAEFSGWSGLGPVLGGAVIPVVDEI